MEWLTFRKSPFKWILWTTALLAIITNGWFVLFEAVVPHWLLLVNVCGWMILVYLNFSLLLQIPG
jgi:hypothetical protein